MIKHFLSTTAILLTVITLASCTNTNKQSSPSSSTSSSSKVKLEQSSSSSSGASSSSSDVKVEIAPSEVSYLTDEEISAIQTIADFKNAYRSLTKSYVADFEHLISQVPSQAQDVLKPTRDELVTMFDEQLVEMENQIAEQGLTDDSPIPESDREQTVSSLRTARDQLIEAMAAARKQASSMLD